MGGEQEGPADMRKKESGDQGEALTARFLESWGYAILARQWRCRFGELDIVCRSPDGVLCFVEVKRRGSGSIGLPREFVDERKQARLRKSAAMYLATCSDEGPVRFDVAEVYEEIDGSLRVEYLEEAFE